MKLLALLVLGFYFPFLSTASNDLFGLRLTVFEDVEKFFYDNKIASAIGDHDNLFTLMSYTDDLKKIFLNFSDKTKSELYEIAFNVFEYSLKATGEFDKLYSKRIYEKFQNFIIRQIPVLREVEELSKRSTGAGGDRMNSFDDFIDIKSYDFNENSEFNAFSDDVLTDLNDDFLFTSVGSLLEAPPVIQPSFKRSYDDDLAAKKWDFAGKKLSKLYIKIYNYVKGLPDRSLHSKFLAGTKINENLKKSFNELAESKAPFYERSIVDHFSSEVEKFVVTLEVEDQKIINLFVTTVMEIGEEIYKEIKDEFKELEQKEGDEEDEKEDIHVQDFKRKRIETTTSPINLLHDSQNIPEDFKIEEEQFGIPSRNDETGNYYGDEDEKIDEDNETFIDIASSEELQKPETVAFLNDPFVTLQDIVITTNITKFDGVRSIYYGFINRDFKELGDEGRALLGNVLDQALFKAFKSE